MHTKDFDYNLPAERIAQFPIDPRDQSRLMVIDKQKKTREHRHFFDIVDYMQPGDLIVWNNSKVFKARLYGKLLSKNGIKLLVSYYVSTGTSPRRDGPSGQLSSQIIAEA